MGALEHELAVVDVLAACRVWENVPRIDPLGGRDDFLFDGEIDPVAVGGGGDRLHLGCLGCRGFEHAHADARRVGDDLADFAAILGLHHPVADPRFGGLGLLPGQLDLLDREILDGERDADFGWRCWCCWSCWSCWCGHATTRYPASGRGILRYRRGCRWCGG